jgi:capsular exopolysaccharide synthesis family protein
MADSSSPAGAASYAFSTALVTLGGAASAQAEAIRAMRTYVMAQHVGRGRRALAVCAATEGAGCSYTAANLAAALSQIGIKTLLIDGDLRRPSLEQFIRPSGPITGLAQNLAEAEGGISNHIQHDVMANLSVMYSGGAPTNPQELLASDRFKVVMDHCLREYEMTVIDTPPAALCADARRISSVVGYSLVVAKQHESRISDVRTLIGQLEQDGAAVIGSVMTEG